MPTMKPEDWLTTAQAAAELGVSARRVVALIKAGRLPSRRLNETAIKTVHLIRRSDLELVRDRPPGRPANPPSRPIRKRT